MKIAAFSRKRWGTEVVALAVVAGALVALAAQPAAAAVTYAEAYHDPIHKIYVVGNPSATSTTSSGAWVDVPGAAVGVTVKGTHADLLIARFTAKSACFGASGYCQVRIVATAAEMAPGVGTNFAFDSSDGGTETGSSWESHAMERSLVVTGGSTCSTFTNYNVKVQYRVSAPGLTFWLDDWHLTVDQLHSLGGGGCPG